MKPWEVYDFTPREFQNYSQGILDRMKSDQRNDWERTRWLGYIFAQPYDTKGRIKSPKDLMLLADEVPDQSKRKKRAEELFRNYL